MKKTLVCKIVVALAVVSLFATSALAQKGSDAFNRSALGGTWTVTAGTLSISSHAMVGSSLSLGYLHGASTAKAASALVMLSSTDLEYGAVAVGNIAGGHNAFVKIQADDGSGAFVHGAFYTGNNGSGNFFALSSPVPSPAILDVFFCGTVATMRITSAAGVQTYTNDYGTTFGAGAGLGTYGSVHLDNFVGSTGGCGHEEVHGIPASQMRTDVDPTLGK